MYDTDDIARYSFIRGDGRLEAALEIAELAHSKSPPRRTGQPYIEHPLLVARILDQFGCDSVQKAVGLLHDVMEEEKCKDLFPDVATLETMLFNGLKARCCPREGSETDNLQIWAKHVCQGVQELTNGAIMYGGKHSWQVDNTPQGKGVFLYVGKRDRDTRRENIASGDGPGRFLHRGSKLKEGKRTYQVERATHQISDEFKPVKIIDQAASVIDDILYCNPNDPEAMEKAKNFALKALDVSRACRGEDHNNVFHEFFKSIYAYLMKNYELAEAGDFIGVAARQGKFNIEHAVNVSKTPRYRRQVKAPELLHYYSPAYPDIETGVARITVLKQNPNLVVGYGVAVLPDEDGDGVANCVADRLCRKLEDRKNVWVETGPLGEPVRLPNMRDLEQHKGISVRDYTLQEPLPWETFIEHAKDAGAIDRSFQFGVPVALSQKKSSLAL
jgi:hypothetical protein